MLHKLIAKQGGALTVERLGGDKDQTLGAADSGEELQELCRRDPNTLNEQHQLIAQVCPAARCTMHHPDAISETSGGVRGPGVSGDVNTVMEKHEHTSVDLVSCYIYN